MYVLSHPYIGLGASAFSAGITSQSAAVPLWDTVQRFPLGLIVPAQENIVPSASSANPTNAFGGGEFMYCQWRTNSTLVPWSLVTWDTNYALATVPASTTTLLGKQVGVLAFASLPAVNSTAPAFCWVQITGQVPAVATATVVAGAKVGQGTSVGTVSGTIVASACLLNITGAAASAATITKANCSMTNGSAVLTVPNVDGLYVGSALTGSVTGIPGSTTLQTILPDQRTVVMSANATATASFTLTQTNTGFIIVNMNRPFAQGPIT